MQSCRIGISPGGHGLIELNDFPGVEELAWGHERVQGVLLPKPHRVSKLVKGGKSWKVIKMLVVQILAIAIGISWNGATMEDSPFGNGAGKLILRNVKNWTLCR